MLVNDFLRDSAERFPDKVALVCNGQRLTYAQVEEQANRVANGLLALGVQRGERVAVWLPNSVETVIAIFAILKAGATFTVINPTTKPGKLTYILNNCAASGLFAPGRRGEQVIPLFGDVPSVRFAVLCGRGAVQMASVHPDSVAFPHMLEAHSPTCPPCPTVDVDLACLIYTSGSTGEPKGVMSTHANVVFAASSIIQYLENVSEDIVINVLPLAFDYGLYQLLMVFKFGGTSMCPMTGKEKIKLKKSSMACFFFMINVIKLYCTIGLLLKLYQTSIKAIKI